MDDKINLDNVILEKGDNKPIIINITDGLKLIHKKELKHCSDCPHPCI